MALLYAKERLYHTLDRKEVVKEGDPRAAFLLVGEGAALPEEEARRLGVHTFMQDESPLGTPLERERAALKDAEDRGAHYEAESRRAAIGRLEAGEQPLVAARAAAGNVPATISPMGSAAGASPADAPESKAAPRAAHADVKK